MSRGDQSQRRREDRRAALRRQEPQRESNQWDKAGVRYFRRARKIFGSVLLKSKFYLKNLQNDVS